MSGYQNSISLGIKLQPSKEVQNELENVIGQLEKNSSIDLKIDTKQINQSLKEFGDTLNNINTQIKNGFNFGSVFNTQASSVEGVTNKIKEEQKAIEQTANTMKTLSSTKVQVLNDDGSVKETLKDITKLQDGISKTITLTNDLKNKKITSSTTDNSGKQNIDDQKAMYKSLFDEISNQEKQKIANTKEMYKGMFDEIDTKEKTSIKDKTQMYTEMFNTIENREKEYSKLFDEANAKELQMTEQIAKANEKTQINRNNTDKANELKQSEAINKSLEEEYQARLKLEKVKDTMQGKLNSADKNEFVNTSVITELQNKLNGINTNTAEKEIKELQTTINNLSSSDNSIVRLQSTISKMESSLTSMKSKYGSLVGDSSSKSSLDAYISEIEKLKTLMASLQNGGTMSGQKLASELNLGTEASRNLSNSVKNSSSALKLAQQDANSFGGTLSKVLSNAGIYMGAYQGIQMLTSAVKEGAKYVEYLNASFTDMKMTMDISESGFAKLSSEIDEMGKKIGAVSTDMHDIARVYSNANTSVDEIMKKVKSASELSNISGMSGVDTTKSIQSVTQQFRLMDKAGADVSEVTQHIGDVLTNVSRNMSFDFADGINQMTNAIKQSGSVAKNAGMDLEQYSAYIGALVQNTGRSGEELSNGFKMISARVLQMKDVSEEMGVSAEDQSKAEKALSKLNIGIRNGGGDLKDLNTILQEVGNKWNRLTDVEKQYTSEMLAGNRQRDIFMSLMSSMPDVQNLYGKALQSTGALEDANAIKAESYQGKLNTLKTTFNQLSATMINGSALKGGLDIASGTLNGINTIASTLGTFPTLIMAVTGALTIFNTKFRENINIIGGAIPGYSKLSNSLAEYRTKLSESAIKQAENISTLKTFEMAYQSGGVSVKGMATQLAGMETKLIATRLAMVATTVATVAMETAVSMGLSLAVSFAMTKIMDLVNAQENLKKSNEEVISSYKSEKESVTNSNKLLEEKQKLEDQLANTNEGTKENKDLKIQLLDIERQLATALPNSTTQYDEQGKAISTNNTLIQKQIDLKKQAMLDDTLKQLDKSNSGTSSISWSPMDMIGKGTNMGFGATTLENIDKTIEKYKQLKEEAEKSSNEATTSFGKAGALEDLQRYNKMLDEATSKSSQYKILIMNAIDAGKSTSDLAERFGVSEDVIKSFGRTVDNTTEKQKQNSNQTEQNANQTKVLAQANKELQSSNNGLSADTIKQIAKIYPEVGDNAEKAKIKVDEMNKSLKDTNNAKAPSTTDLTKSYSDAISKASDLKTLSDELNKSQSMTPDLIAKVASAIPDIGSKITDVKSVQEALNGKIQEQLASAQEVYLQLEGDDEQFYQDKVKNSQNFQDAYTGFLNAFNTEGEQAYSVDYQKYSTFNGLKQGVQNDLGKRIETWLTQFVGSSATGYADDFKNFKSYAEAKAGMIAKLQEQINKFENALSYNAEVATKSTSEYASTEAEKLYAKNISGFNDKIQFLKGKQVEIETTFNEFNGKTQGYTGGNIGGGSPDKTSGSADKAQKEADDALKKAQEWADKIAELKSEIKTDPYLEDNNKLAQLDSQLQAVKTSQDGLTGSELAQAKTKENEILQKQIDTYKSLEAKQEIEKDNIAYTLSQYGIEADSLGNLSNATEILAQKQSEIDNMYGSSEPEFEAKKKLIEQQKQINDYVSQYGTIVNKTIPDTIDKYEQLANAIKKAKEEAQKANEELVDQTADKLVTALKQQYEDQKTTKLTSLKKAYESDVKDIESSIDELQDKLDELNSDDSDNETKLSKLKTELANLQKDNSTEAQLKIQNTQTQITDLEKTIAKNKLQSKIDDLNTEKSDRETAYNDEVDAVNTKYDKLEDEQKLYNKASQLLTSKNLTKIKELLNSQEEPFKKIGETLSGALGKSMETEIANISNAIDKLTNKAINASNSVDSTGSGSTGSTSKADVNYVNSDGSVTTISGKDGTSTTTGGSSSSKSKTKTNSNGSKTTTNSDNTTTTTSANGKTTETSGTYSNGTKYTIVKYDTGGRTPSDIGADGKVGILHANEKILNEKDTVMIDDIWNHVKVADDTIMQLSNMVNSSSSYSLPSAISQIDLNKLANSVTNTSSNDNSKTNSININNNYDVNATTDFDTKLFSKNIDKQYRDTLRKAGILKR